MITLTFACGHTLRVKEDVKDPPECHCGERRVQRVKAPAPRFTHGDAVSIALKE